jgi:cytochrome c553
MCSSLFRWDDYIPHRSKCIPRLGGLDSAYLNRRLEQWNQGYHVAAGPPMISIASKLSDDQIEALASYLSFVK